MKPYKCIIFDCDGVLVDSEAIANRVLVDMANEVGANIDLDYGLKNFKGKSLTQCFTIIVALSGNTKALNTNFETEFRQRSFKAFNTEIKPVKGVESVLQQLDIPFCVASNGPQHKIKLNLELTGLINYFNENVFSAYTINKWKPEPDLFLWAAKTMGFSPDECLVIEDSLAGVKAARAGGFDVFGYTEQDYHNVLQPEATTTFNDMKDLLDMIK